MNGHWVIATKLSRIVFTGQIIIYIPADHNTFGSTVKIIKIIIIIIKWSWSWLRNTKHLTKINAGRKAVCEALRGCMQLVVRLGHLGRHSTSELTLSQMTDKLQNFFLDALNYYIFSQHEFLWGNFLNVHFRIFLPFKKKENHFLLHVSWVGWGDIVDNAVFVILLNTFSKLRCDKSRLLLQQWCLLSCCSVCHCDISVCSNGAVKTLETEKLGIRWAHLSFEGFALYVHSTWILVFVQPKHSCPTCISMYL